jgi:hypothetical protein
MSTEFLSLDPDLWFMLSVSVPAECRFSSWQLIEVTVHMSVCCRIQWVWLQGKKMVAIRPEHQLLRKFFAYSGIIL